jgi:hypothetical protein
MSYTPPRDPDDSLDPASMHSLGYTLVASALTVIGTVAAVMAVLYPVTATGGALLVGASWYGVRTLRRYYRTRKRAGWSRELCVPKTDVCVEL